MGVLNFEDGRKTYQVNGGCEIRFNPTDINLVEGIFALVEKVEAQQRSDASANDATLDVFAISRERNSQMRADIDELFGEPICDKIFGKTNVFSPANGLPLCMNFLMAIIDEINDATQGINAAANPRVEKYMKKYEKYMKK